MKKLTAVVLGYGMRGSTYAKYAAEHPANGSTVGGWIVFQRFCRH